MSPKSQLPPLRRILALLAVVFLLGTACGADDDSTDSASSGDSGGDPVTTIAGEVVTDDRGTDQSSEPDSADVTQGEDDALGGGATTGNLTPADIGRQIIFTAVVAVEVDDVAEASREASDIIESVGGFVFGQNTVGGGEARSELTFKVRPERFSEALERLGTIGELRNQTITTDDVTERVVDLESRIEVAELGVDRLRAALENATDLEDFATIEQLLLNRESDLEVMRGQLRTLEDRVDLATITLILTQDVVSNSVELDVTMYERHDGGLACPGDERIGSVEAGTPMTLCFEVRNTGDQTLTAITITDTVLEIETTTDLIQVFEPLDELAPGQSGIVAYEFTPERTLRPRTRVSAVPTDGVTADPVGPAVNSTRNYEVRTFEPDADPGFGDGFDAASGVLAAVWLAITVTVGFLVPMLVFIPFAAAAWFAWRWRKPRTDRRRAEREAARRDSIDSYRQPPPPATTPAGADETPPGQK